ncbi:MAG: DUF2339 domain-containing protein [Acidobacteriota bacterium]
MSPEEQLRQLGERMDALSTANARLVRRVSELERQLTGLTGKPPEVMPEAIPAPQPPTEQPLPQPGLAVDLPAEPPPTSPPHTAPPPTSPPPLETPSLESKVGLAWVNRIAVVTCIFAAAFFFKYAADNEWIGPSGRIILGLLAGCASLFFAERFHARAERVYSQGLCGLGVSLLYLSFFAAFNFYHLIPQGPSFALMALTSVLAGALAMRFESQAIAALALIGGFLTPPLLSTGNFNAPFFYAYLLALAYGAQWLARKQNWPTLAAFSLAGTIVLAIGSIDQMERTDTEGYFVAFTVAAFAIFVNATFPLVAYLGQFAFPILLFAAKQAGFLPFAAALVAMTAAALVWGVLRERAHALPLAYVAASISTYLWMVDSSDDNALTQNVPLAAVLFLLFLAWIPLRARMGRELRTADLTVAAANACTFFGAVYVSFDAKAPSWLGVAALVTAGLHILAGRLARIDVRGTMLFLGLALAFATLAVPLQFSRFYITVAWALEAAAMSWVAERTRSVRVASISLVIALLAGLDLLYEFSGPKLYIPEGTPIPALLFNSRMFTMLVCAASFWFIARCLRNWTAPSPIALPPYVAGHLTLVYALTLEVIEWAYRGSEIENISSVSRLAVTILYALYAVALISLGVATRTTINRILGLIAIAFVILKLYLYDVWNLSTIYRVIAFGALGGLLLLTSFLYSRYRGKIESLWQGDNS